MTGWLGDLGDEETGRRDDKKTGRRDDKKTGRLGRRGDWETRWWGDLMIGRRNKEESYLV